MPPGTAPGQYQLVLVVYDSTNGQPLRGKPVNGAKTAEPGLLLSPSQPALTMAFTGRLYVRTYIPETKLGVVRTSLAATVTVDSFPGKSFPAHVTEISPDAEFTPKPVDTPRERVNLVYAAKVDLDAGWSAPLVPGQPADVRVKAQSAAK